MNKNNKSKELNNVESYSQNLVKNLVDEFSKKEEDKLFFEKKYEEDFYTKEINLENNDKSLEEYKNDFFNYNDAQDEENINIKSIVSIKDIIYILLISILFILNLFFSIKFFSTKEKLEIANLEIENLTIKNNDIEKKLSEEDLKNEIAKLQEENESLKSTLEKNNTQEVNQENKIPTTSQNPNSQEDTTNNINNSNYTVQKGDNIWNISKKVYGNSSRYQEILNANGLTENSTLQEGQKLIIP